MLRRGWLWGASAKLHRTAEKQVNVTCRARAEGKHRAARWPAQRFDGKLPGKLGESLQTLANIVQTWERLGAAVVLVHALGIDGGPAATAHGTVSCQGMGCKARGVQINPPLPPSKVP